MVRTGSVSLQPQKTVVGSRRFDRTPASGPTQYQSLRQGKTTANYRDNWKEAPVSGRVEQGFPLLVKMPNYTIQTVGLQEQNIVFYQ